MRYVILLLLLIVGCAHNMRQLNRIRMDCLSEKDHKGIFHISFTEHITGWAPDEIECWYGVNEAQLRALQLLGHQPKP
jgi:hypothetical protein